MIIKLLSRQTKSYRQLLEYISDENKTRWQEETHPSFIITHNIKGKSILKWVEQFKQNEEYRKIKRTDSIYIYHEILSWNDNENLTPEKMEAMTREYMQLRNPNGMYVAYPHFDGEYHVHICASGIEYKTGKSMRLPKKDLAVLKQKTQQYQIENYPELTSSIVKHGKGKKGISDREYQYKLRTGKITEKEQVKKVVESYLQKATSKDSFFKLLNENGLKTYIRGGAVYGVQFGKCKHRFKTMGITLEQFIEFDKRIDQKNDLSHIRNKKQNRNKGREY